MRESAIIFRQPDEKEFEQVKQVVEDLWLDDENLKREQFHIILDDGKVIAFGRLREHEDAIELCTLGVSKDCQKKGLGGKMVKHLLSQANSDVYVVTVIPGFFAKFDFKFVENYPASLQKKVKICCTNYNVGETYRVMKWERK